MSTNKIYGVTTFKPKPGENTIRLLGNFRMRMGFWILEGRDPVYIGDDYNRLLDFTGGRPSKPIKETVVGPALVSTIFLCTDHNWRDEGPPVLFETMIFGGFPEIDLYQSRCSTYDEAEREHRYACQVVVETARRRHQSVIDTLALTALILLTLTWTLL